MAPRQNSKRLESCSSKKTEFLFFSLISSFSKDHELPQCATFNEALVKLYEENLKAYLAAFAFANNLDFELDASKCELVIGTWMVEASYGKAKDLVEKYKKILRKRLLEPSRSSIEGVLADSLRSPHINQFLISGAYKIYSAYKVLHTRDFCSCLSKY